MREYWKLCRQGDPGDCVPSSAKPQALAFSQPDKTNKEKSPDKYNNSFLKLAVILSTKTLVIGRKYLCC